MAEQKTFQTNDLLNYYLTMNMNNICRVCLEKGKLMPIFDPIKPPHFSILIMACAQIQVVPSEFDQVQEQVQEGDGLPPYICHKCVSKMNIAFQFKIQCESSDARLRSCFENNVQQISDDKIHISSAGYISELKNDPELSNTSISITFATNDENLNDTATQIQTIQEVGDITVPDHIESHDTLPDLTVENHLSTLENVTSLPELEKVSLTELKLEFSDLRPNDINLKVKELNLNVDATSQVKSNEPKKVEHQCGTCGKVFRLKPSLVHHIRTHTGERPYICLLCDKRFINGGHLHTHMRTHTGEKNHVCAACHKAFSTAQQLTKHTIAIHTSERPYACSYCTKRFASSSNLRTHTRIHTGEKNFRCDQCGKAFCTKGQLEQHMLTHTGEKAFLCEYCHKRFSQKCHLLRHLNTHRVP